MNQTVLHKPSILKASLLAAMLTLGGAPLMSAQAQLPDFVQTVKEVSPTVVNISTTQKRPKVAQGMTPGGVLPFPEGHPFNDLFKHFYDGQPGGDMPNQRPVQSLGSGFIIDASGIILTNAHVVKDAESISVRLQDKRELPAKVLGMDERTDVAVLKIEASALPVARLGNSDQVEVGEWVLAIGSPFGLDFTATQGIVSALARNLPDDTYVPFIQTDAAVNPGNSGGPLFNTKGEVIGINSQIYSRSGGYMGLSFAIPINTVTQVADQLRTGGKVVRGWLGVMIQPIDADLAKSFGLDRPRGALVAQVQPDSPAAKAGLKSGDVILKLNGQTIDNTAQLPAKVAATAIGTKVELQILRDGKEKTLSATIEKLKDDQASASSTTSEPGESSLGLAVQPLTDAQRKELDVQHGLLVRGVGEGAAGRAGVRPGDVLMELGGVKLESVNDLKTATSKLKSGQPVALRLMRNGSPLFIALKVE
ncbi:MAG: DegQ family serine endoprotease [Halothiobacillaceae bacterium]|nr:DegQ family serine endoprotease [Halothiobacillaceae bacterium]